MKLLVLALISIFDLSTSASADTNEFGGYFQLDGGTAQFADGEINRRAVTFDDGWSVNGRIGAGTGRLIGELEVGLHGANYDPVGKGYSPALFLTAGFNLIYKFLQLPGLDVYGGLGGGVLSDDPPISIIQISAHAESGLIMEFSEHAQLVPHIRTIAIFGASEDRVGRSQSYAQYISTARLGIRFTP